MAIPPPGYMSQLLGSPIHVDAFLRGDLIGVTIEPVIAHNWLTWIMSWFVGKTRAEHVCWRVTGEIRAPIAYQFGDRIITNAEGWEALKRSPQINFPTPTDGGGKP